VSIWTKDGVKSMKLVQIKELHIKRSVGQVLKLLVGVLDTQKRPLKFSFYTKKSLPNEEKSSSSLCLIFARKGPFLPKMANFGQN